MINVICETIDNKANNRKFGVQTRHAANSQNCSTNRGLQTKPNADNTSGDKTHIPDYLSSSKTKLKCLIIFIPVTTKKLTKEQVKQW